MHLRVISAIWYSMQTFVACIQIKRKNTLDYVDISYSTELYLRTYSFMLQPMPSSEYWLQTGMHTVLPPNVKKQPGRPKKMRVRGQMNLDVQAQRRAHIKDKMPIAGSAFKQDTILGPAKILLIHNQDYIREKMLCQRKRVEDQGQDLLVSWEEAMQIH